MRVYTRNKPIFSSSFMRLFQMYQTTERQQWKGFIRIGSLGSSGLGWLDWFVDFGKTMQLSFVDQTCISRARREGGGEKTTTSQGRTKKRTCPKKTTMTMIERRHWTLGWAVLRRSSLAQQRQAYGRRRGSPIQTDMLQNIKIFSVTSNQVCLQIETQYRNWIELR